MALLRKRVNKDHAQKAGGEGDPKSDGLDFARIEYFAKREAGRLNFEMLSLEAIELDPTNARTEGVDPTPMLQVLPKFLNIDPKHPEYDAQLVADFDEQMALQVQEVIKRAGEQRDKVEKLFENLEPLKNNIRLIGVKSPIEVEALDRKGRYRIVYGHRRYLASILAGERNISARIVQATVGRKHVQASENFLQEELSLPDRLQVIQQLLEELDVDPATPATRVSAVTGYAKSQMALYLTVIRGQGPALRDAIATGRLSSLRDAARIAKLDHTEQPAQLESVLGGVSPQTAVSQKKASPKKGKGRPKTYIATPKLRNPLVVKMAIERMGVLDDLPAATNVNWDDFGEIEMLWNQVFELLTAEVNNQAD